MNKVHHFETLVNEDLVVFHDVYHSAAAQAVQSDSRHILHGAIDLKHQQAVSSTRYIILKHMSKKILLSFMMFTTQLLLKLCKAILGTFCTSLLT